MSPSRTGDCKRDARTQAGRLCGLWKELVMRKEKKYMKTTIILLALLIVGITPAATERANENKPRIEVCFVLDTTGSMGGLIEGAKQKIWSIATEMISAKPTPELKLGLVG